MFGIENMPPIYFCAHYILYLTPYLIVNYITCPLNTIFMTLLSQIITFTININSSMHQSTKFIMFYFFDRVIHIVRSYLNNFNIFILYWLLEIILCRFYMKLFIVYNSNVLLNFTFYKFLKYLCTYELFIIYFYSLKK